MTMTKSKKTMLTTSARAASRRDVLRTAAAFGGAGLASAALPSFAALTQSQLGYKALVCVFLAGGMDGHDTLIPQDADGYAQWADVREELLALYERAGDDSRARGNLRRLGVQAGGRAFGMPRQMGGLADLYTRGRMAVVGNVGPLVAPTTAEEALGGRVPLPPKLMSHNDQQSVWQSLSPEGARSGWGGRMADILASARSPYTAISVSGNPVFLASPNAAPLFVGTDEVREVYRNSSDWSHGSTEVPAALREHFAAAAGGLNNHLASDYQNAQRASVSAINDLAAMANGTEAGEEVRLEGNALSAQLATVAKLISLRAGTGVSRQVFFVQMGGFDTHKEQHRDLPKLQQALSDAMASFYRWTEGAGVADAVTTFTASDFGRTLTTNADGTDHGWGNHHLAVGGAVRGGRIVGTIPEAVEGHGQDFGRGRLVPTLATAQYAASLGRWFGLSSGQLADALPGLGRFDERGAEIF